MNARWLRRRLLVAIGGTAVSVSACSAGSSAGDAKSPDKPADTTGGPWAERIAGPGGGGTRTDRVCFTRAAIDSAAKSPMTACPTVAGIVDIGLVTLPPPPPPGQMPMAGMSLVDGPAEWKGECCYLRSAWHTGRPFSLDGDVRHARLASTVTWG